MHHQTKITPENKTAIDAYINYEKAKNYKTTTLNNHKSYLNMIFKTTTKSWKDLDHTDIITIINQFENPRTREVIKNTLRKFLIYQQRKKLAQHIKFNSRILNTPIKGDEAKLTPEEITQMIDTPNDLVHKALIETFIITGARESEIAQLTIGDVDIKPDTIWIHIRHPKGDSPPRRIPIVPNDLNPVARYPRHLIQYIQYRINASSTDPLFIAKKTGRAMTKSGIYHIIKNIGQNIPDKNVTPHILRHTGASYDGQYLNEAMLCKKYGWSIGSKMASRYCHFSEQQLEQQLMKQAGIIKEDVIQGKVCPRCGSINNVHAEHCTKCQQLLDTKKLIEESQQLIHEQETQAEKIAQMEKQMEVFAATIRNMNFFKHGYITPDGTELLVDDMELVKDYTKHHENMKYMRKHGLESWRKLQLAKRKK